MISATITFQDAVRKSRFGRKDWISFKTRAGEHIIERCSPALIKKALLEGGTKVNFTIISEGIPYRINWRLALIRLRNAKRDRA
jgi:hypothetical protein